MHETYKGVNIQELEYRRWENASAEDPKEIYGLIDFCVDNIKPTDHLLELGCCLGASTSIFAQFAKKITTADVYFRPEAKKYLQKYNNIEYIEESSLNLASARPLNYDILYIDTIHTEDHCYKELKSLAPLCTSNPKKIGGHDWWSEGVRNAARKYFNKEPTKTYTDTSWIYC